jgi:asparagine synthase (glutamine-hydrolysing)
MCGIAGQISISNSPPEPEVVARMIASLDHRGPDARGVYQHGCAALANARLQIIDVEGGGQPMSNEDGNLWITFNGEIFNYLELRDLLLSRGHRFSTRSDTEVILHLFEDEGDACVQRLNGQWAFAIWDQRSSKLFLSRDRMGVRPLFYTQAPGAFLFASEIKALFEHPGVRREIDIQSLDEIFTFWCNLAPRTAFEGVYELPPGCSLWLSDGRIDCKPHWQMEYRPQPAMSLDLQATSSELLALLQDATRVRMHADVPVGAYLSGGLDSTLIAALAQREISSPLRTFSLAFENSEFDETGFQDQAVRFLGTDHRRVTCMAQDIQRVFPDVIRHAETPILRTAPAPMYLLSKTVRESGVKAVLTGEGADEMFGGYDIFKEAKIRRFWAAQPQSQMRPLLLRKLYPYLSNLRAQPAHYLQAFFRHRGGPLFYSHGPRWDLTSRLKLFFSVSVRERLAGGNALDRLTSQLPAGFSSWNWLSQAEYLETSLLLPGYILSSQGDRMSPGTRFSIPESCPLHRVCPLNGKSKF